MSNLKERLDALSPARLRGVRRGIEKESLRAQPDGKLALTPHPAALGSALTHPHITTDFSESQLELITGVHADVESCLDELVRVHQFTYRVLDEAGDELLWVSSMPCGLPTDETIPIGRYGSSNVGAPRASTAWAWRTATGGACRPSRASTTTGRCPDVSSEQYFALIRNFRRHAFLLLYLFGASPAVCSSFVDGRPHELQPLGDGTHVHAPRHVAAHGPAGLPERGAGLAGRELQQPGRLWRFAAGCADPALPGLRGHRHPQPRRRLQPARHQPAADRERVLRHHPPQARDLSRRAAAARAARARRRIRRGAPDGPGPVRAGRHHGADHALPRRVPAALPAGGQPAGHAARRSPRSAHNQHLTAACGREPGLQLQRGGREVALTEWGAELLAQCAPIAAALDAAHGGTELRRRAARRRRRAARPDRAALGARAGGHGAAHDNSFVGFIRAQSSQTRETLLALPFPAEQQAQFERMTQSSIEAPEGASRRATPCRSRSTASSTCRRRGWASRIAGRETRAHGPGKPARRSPSRLIGTSCSAMPTRIGRHGAPRCTQVGDDAQSDDPYVQVDHLDLRVLGAIDFQDLPVEDNPVIRDNLVGFLEDDRGRDGDRARQRRSRSRGLAATNTAIAGTWRIVDLFLDQGNGLGVVDACRNASAHQKVVVLSNYATTGYARALQGAWAPTPSSTSPPKIDLLLDFLRECMSLRNLGRARRDRRTAHLRLG